MDKNFIGRLFDLSFSEFVTTSIVKFIYILMLGIAAIVSLGILFSGFSSGSFMGVVGGVLFAPIVFLLIAVYSRVALEVVIVLFRIAENTARMAARQGSDGP